MVAKKLTDEGLESLAEGIKELKQLRSMNLRFGSCKELTDSGLERLGEGLSDSPLQKIVVSFAFCKKITDLGLMKLGKELKRLNNLKSLDIELEV